MFSVKVITAVALTSVVHGVPCKALVLSGGSNNGAWEVGVMWGLTNYGDPTDYYWDVVSGISAGAINTAGTAGWRSDEVVEMNQYLSDSWLY
jgi:predicted acylesterase/phospholipase RssA